jgi:hypothetical protein
MNLKENLRLGRLFFLLLAIFTVGRWALSLKQVPYDRGSPVFSLVTLTVLSCIYYSAFTRRYKGYRVLQAVTLSITLSFVSQAVILLSTLASYVAGIDSYFNHPLALNVEARIDVGQAMTARAFGLVFNSLVNGSIAGALGWAMGGLLPEK